jgi:exodeoxyribonuclease-3
MSALRFVTWNVNGIRAAVGQGFFDWLEAEQPEVVALQEVRARLDQFDAARAESLGYTVVWHDARKPGYSGVATLSRLGFEQVEVGLGEPRFDDEGRVLQTRQGGIVLLNAYFPNAQRDLARIEYKVEFYAVMLARVNALRATGEHVVICGDWNTAHQNVDIENWRANQKTSGFTPRERALVDECLGAGLHDAFRELYPETTRHYSWWSNRPGVRERNIGWRIDYHLVADEAWHRVVDARVRMEVKGSDHCPVELWLSPPATPARRSTRR